MNESVLQEREEKKEVVGIELGVSSKHVEPSSVSALCVLTCISGRRQKDGNQWEECSGQFDIPQVSHWYATLTTTKARN